VGVAAVGSTVSVRVIVIVGVRGTVTVGAMAGVVEGV
jgi:hypothetical protein